MVHFGTKVLRATARAADWPKWLGEEPASEQELLALLKTCPDDWLKIWPVDNKVGNVRNTGAELVLPLETLV